MKKYFISIVLLASFLGFTQNAKAACGITIVANDLNLDWDLSWTSHAITISVSKTQVAACTFGLAFSKGGAGSYNRRGSSAGNLLRYQLSSDIGGSKVLKDVPDITSANDVIMVTLPGDTNPQTITYYFDIPFANATTPTLALAAAYTDNFSINAYEGTDPTAFVTPDASTSVNVTINVPKIISLSMVDTGGVFDESATTKNINFGSVTPGQTSRFDLRIRTNAGYSVTASSSNAGKLKHSVANAFVPYTFYINSVLTDMSGVTPAAVGATQTGLGGLGLPVKIVIGTLGALPMSGTYSDSILITAITTE
jgi:spore coat protein U-like protein